MISVIICSINKNLAEQVQKSISETIGVPWEAIIIDNTQCPQGITRIYNIGASKAQYDILCFVHEDVIFSSQNWGNSLITHFNNDLELALIGIAGSKYKSNKPSGWYTHIHQADCCNVWHKDSKGHNQRILLTPNPASSYEQVVCLDGVFLCTRKNVWNEHPFDEDLLKGFHLYDIDFSIRISKKYKVIVTYEIHIIHLTEGGDFGNKWVDDTQLWHQKNKLQLPVFSNDLMPNTTLYNRIVVRTWLNRLKNENIDFLKRIKWLKKSGFWHHPNTWPHALLFLFKKLLK